MTDPTPRKRPVKTPTAVSRGPPTRSFRGPTTWLATSADRATHLAQDTLERGRDDIRRVDLSTRAGQPNGGGLRGASPLTTALAVGAMGYAIATLIRGAVRKRDIAPGSALPDKVPPAARG